VTSRPAGIQCKESTCVDDTRVPRSLQPSLRHQNTHKSYQYNQYSRLKKHSANRCVRIYSEGREIIAPKYSLEREAPCSGAIGEFQGRDEYQRRLGDSKARRLEVNASSFRMRTSNHKPRMKVISRYMRRSSAGPRIWVALYSQVGVPHRIRVSPTQVDSS
jgi:hypothetical protein